MNKVDFLTKLRHERMKFEDLLAVCGIDQLDLPGVSGYYSIKDIVAHLNAYNQTLVRWIKEAKAGRIFVDNVLDQPDLDARNSVVYEKNKNQKPEAVIKAFQQTWDELEEAVGLLTDEELTDSEQTAWFVEPRWQRKQELWRCIANDSYEHQKQHTPDIERWLAEHASDR